MSKHIFRYVHIYMFLQWISYKQGKRKLQYKSQETYQFTFQSFNIFKQIIFQQVDMFPSKKDVRTHRNYMPFCMVLLFVFSTLCSGSPPALFELIFLLKRNSTQCFVHNSSTIHTHSRRTTFQKMCLNEGVHYGRLDLAADVWKWFEKSPHRPLPPWS